jgi:hypothetical protein
MTTVIEDNQLNTELQELYLISKHWISDLDFFGKELKFLENLLVRTFSGMLKQERYENIATIMLNVARIEHKRNEIKCSVLNYMHSLEPLIAKTSEHFDLSLVETHAQLEIEIGELLHSFQTIKQQIFKSTSEKMKSIHINHNRAT